MSAAGKYKCTSNDDETSCELSVYLKNRWLKELQNVTIKESENALFECQVADHEAKVVWYHKGDRILDMADLTDKYEVKNLGGGVHQLIINDCLLHEAGDIKAVCGDLETKASLEVKKKEKKPEVSVDDQDSEDGKMKGKYKG